MEKVNLIKTLRKIYYKNESIFSVNPIDLRDEIVSKLIKNSNFLKRLNKQLKIKSDNWNKKITINLKIS